MFETYLKEDTIGGLKIFKTFTKIENVHPDPQNPRDIAEDKAEDLKNFIQKYGALKPVLVDIRPEKEGNLIGGNKRLEQFVALGFTEVWIEPRLPESDAQAFEMGTVDNMEFGFYVESKLSTLLNQYKDSLDISKLSVNLSAIPTFEEMLKKWNTEPENTADKNKEVDMDDVGKDLNITCPRCGFQFKGSNVSIDDEDVDDGGTDTEVIPDDPPIPV